MPAKKQVFPLDTNEKFTSVATPKSVVSKASALLPPEFQNVAFDLLFNKYTPAGVIINDSNDIVHFHGDTSPYLLMGPGKPDFNILKMARPELAFALRNCILKTKVDDTQPIVSEPLLMKTDNHVVECELIPIAVDGDKYHLVLFHKNKYIPPINQDTLVNDYAQQRIQLLEAELEQLRDDLRRVSVDFEVSTEELQSANEGLLCNSEELQSLNEELETSAEMLHSNYKMLSSTNDGLMDRQEQLIAARLYAEAIVETIREPLLILDKDLQVKSANSSYYKYFKTTEDQTQGRPLTELGIGPLGNDLLKQELQKIIPNNSRVENFEISTEFPSIGKRTLLLNACQIVNSHQTELILVAFDDVTEQKISRPLRESEERFRALADTAPVLLWITDVDKMGTFFNKGWLDFTGSSLEDQVGTGWVNCIHPSDVENTVKTFNEKFDLREEYYIEYRLRRYDGDYRWVSAKGVPRFSADGAFLGYVGGCMDIDTQKNFFAALEDQVIQRTKDLQESQAFLQSILNTTQNLIYIYDFTLEKITFINGKAIETTGYNSEQIQSSNEDLFTSLIHHEDLPMVLAQRKVLRESDSDKMTTVEFRLKNKLSGWTCQLSRDLVFKRDENGKAIQYLGVCTDVSDIKDANDMLLAKNRELQHSNIELASFSSIASHDLKEPLRKIQIFSKLVIAKDRANVSEDSKNFLDRVIVSAFRMQQLIDDLISYSRTSSIGKINFVSTDMNLLIDDALEDLEELIATEEAIISVPELPVLAVLPSQFRQLFVNLISNAIKYRSATEAPHIVITAEHASPEELEQLEAKPGLDFCKITVADNGIGFLEEYSEKIFEPFQRLHDKDEYSGTGIGLAICKKIMLNHNGFIKAQSEVGKGSKFIIYTPWIN